MGTESMANYTFAHDSKRETSLELFDQYYLKVSQKDGKRERDFRLEVATLNPEAEDVHHRALHWLLAGVISLLAAAYLLMQGAGSASLNPAMLAPGAAAALLGVVFIVRFRRHAGSKWVFKTRASHYPLVHVPYDKTTRQQAKQFVEQLRQAIQLNVVERRYGNELLFAGEVRMLRRLAEKQILTDADYNQAKKRMMKKGS